MVRSKSEFLPVMMQIYRLNPAATDAQVARVLHTDMRIIAKYRAEIEENLRNMIQMAETRKKSEKKISWQNFKEMFGFGQEESGQPTAVPTTAPETPK